MAGILLTPRGLLAGDETRGPTQRSLPLRRCSAVKSFGVLLVGSGRSETHSAKKTAVVTIVLLAANTEGERAVAARWDHANCCGPWNDSSRRMSDAACDVSIISITFRASSEETECFSAP